MTAFIDFNSWFIKSSTLLYNNVSESEINWCNVFEKHSETTSSQGLLFEVDLDTLNKPNKNFINQITKAHSWSDFKYMIDGILCHSDDEKFNVSYSLLKKFKEDNSILKNFVDEDVLKANRFKKQIGRDIHKMRAFVRFNKVKKDNISIYIAYYQPDHFILKKNANFFKERFNNMNWIIFTPHALMGWNKESLYFKKGSFSPKAFPKDPFVDLWKTYFANIFNPSRVKIKAMKNEMPVRFWKNLPEAELIPDLIRSASHRVQVMESSVDKSLESAQTNNNKYKKFQNLSVLNTSLESCKACSLCDLKTNVVKGAGNAKAKTMIVGEAPGDKEDLLKKPFVGPSGRLLKDTLTKINVKKDDLYFTNAVKHFNYTLSEGKRIHKPPKTEHIMACRSWLIKEIDLIRPQKIICLGKTAAHAVFGFLSPLESLRGKRHSTAFSEHTYVTYHPAMILRAKDTHRREALEKAFLNDLDSFFNDDKKDLFQDHLL